MRRSARWCNKFGPGYANRLRRQARHCGDTWFVDEVFVRIGGERHYIYRAVDQDDNTVDTLVQKRRNKQAAICFFRKMLKRQGRSPRRMVTDKLKSYSAAHREVMPSVVHSTEQYENNRAEVSHEPTRQRERQMRRFKTPGQAQRFLAVQGVVLNLFRLGCHCIRAIHYRAFRYDTFEAWRRAACVTTS
jgi:putative transposase